MNLDDEEQVAERSIYGKGRLAAAFVNRSRGSSRTVQHRPNSLVVHVEVEVFTDLGNLSVEA